MRLLIFVFGSLLATAVAQSGVLTCGGSWQQLNEKCFLAVAGSKEEWNSARTDCQNRAGSDLAVIPDQATNTFLMKMMSGVTTPYWLGLHDLPNEKAFIWLDGTALDDKSFTNWGLNEPDNGGWFLGNQDCVTFDPVSGQWFDGVCWDQNPYICERNVSSIPSCDESNGWRSYNGKCYQFFNNYQPWQTADDICSFYQGGNLVYIKSDADQAFMDNIQLNHGLRYWIGLKDGSTDGVYQWSDSSVFDSSSFQKWDTNQPNNKWFGSGGDCAAVTLNGRWFVKKCTTQTSFICEIPEGACAPGWDIFNGNCFQLNTQSPTTWTDAKQTCEAQLAYLAAINTDAENNLMKYYLTDLSVLGINTLYIGVSDLKKDGTFEWTDGSSLGAYSHWLQGQPPALNNQKDCGYINTADTLNAQWLAGDCFMLGAYVCETKVGSKVISVPTTPITNHCEAGWDLHKDYCYVIVRNSATWDDADAACNALGAELISIHNDDIQSFMSVRIDAVKESVWLGLNDKDQEGTFTWSDGTSVNYNNWEVGQPDSDDCVVMKGETTNYGLWAAQSCSKKRYYVCHKKASQGPGTTASPPPTVNYLDSCGTGWEYDTKADKCFLFQPFDRVNWFDARYSCRELGGDLMSLTDYNNLAYASGRLKTVGAGESWIGCNDLGREGGWTWSDKSPFVLINWASGQPDNWYGDSDVGEHCCTIYNTMGTWNDQFCNNWLGYSCNKDDTLFRYFVTYNEKKLTATVDFIISDVWPSECGQLCLDMSDSMFYCRSFDYERETRTCYLRQLDKNSGGGLLPTFDTQHFDHYERNVFVPPPVDPTPVPATMGCAQGWGQYNEYCYYANFIIGDFAAAELECQKLGAEVASITDMNVNNFLRAFIYDKNPSETRFWIGLNDQKQEMLYEWSNGEPVTFTNWNTNEPNDVNGEDCTEFFVDSGFWNDVRCNGYSINSICRKLASTGNPDQPDPSCPLTGNWDNAWNDRCYQINSYAATWAVASTNCKKTSGAQLVVIENRMELAYLSGALGLRDEDDYFIALSDSKVAGYYEWMDGTQITYTNWDEGQPDGRQGHCVTMNSAKDAGYWTDSDCATKYNFICEMARSGFPPITPPTTVPPTSPTDLDCATGWVGYGSRCFQIFEFDKGADAYLWDRANQQCKDMGAALASFHHPDEESYVVSKFSPTTTRRFWIGLNDQRHEGGYAWSDGTQVEYTNWGSGEPNDNGGREECVETDMKGGKWNDKACWNRRNIVCVIPKGKDVITTVAPTIPTGADCPGFPGWKHLYPYCYYFSVIADSLQDWHQAEEACHNLDAHLVSIHNDDERDFINDRLALFVANYWTGLRSNLTYPGEHKWIDQTLIDYKNWETNQPDTQNGEELCVQMKGNTLPPSTSKGKWSDANCGVQARFICKKNIDGTLPTHSVPTAPPDGGCPLGWKKYDNYCYTIKGSGTADDPKKNWQDAKQDCIKSKAYLAAIHNFNTQMYLTVDMFDVNDNVWIGMSALASGGQFVWTDSSSVNFVHWISDNRQTGGTVTDCVSMVYDTEEPGKWDDEECSNEHSFLCMMAQDPFVPTDNPPTNSCPEVATQGYEKFGDVCFKIYSDTKRTFQQANETCLSDQTNVASVLSGFEQAKLHTMLMNIGSAWIGLYDDPVTSILSWVDGWPLEYNNWGWSDPKGLRCVVMKEDLLLYEAGEWGNEACNTKYFTSCKYSNATLPTPYPTMEGYCDGGWTAFGSSCYQVGSGFFDKGTFGDAIYDCEKNYGGSYIATIESKAENTFVMNLAQQKFSVKDFYIGIDRSTNGGWEWVDGSPLTFVNWAEDADSNTGKNCAELRNDAKGKWFHIDCKTDSHYVCEKPKISLISTAAPFNPQPCPTGTDGWKLRDDYCYRPKTNFKSWNDAEAWCNTNGGYLASIHSAGENDFIRQLVPFSFQNYWIGYSKLYDGTAGDDYRWTDTSNPAYENWASGEPNDHLGSQKCAQFLWSGQWDDTNCGDTQNFVCKREKDNMDAIVKPPPVPTVGNCPQDWEKIGTGCYRIQASTGGYKTWDDARIECQKNDRGDLASIHDQGVQSLLTSFIKSHTGHMWNGLRGGTAGWWGYHWVDQSNVDYEHWAKNQPSYFYDEAMCVVMVNDPDYPGRWDDTPCSELHGYLCYQPLDPSYPTSAPPSVNCDIDGYESYFEDCFKLNPTQLTFDEAKKACEDEGAALATIRDGYAEAFVVANMLYEKDKGSAWLGLRANEETGTFGWVDQWPITYTSWSPSSPSGDNNCVIVKDNAVWRDRDCEKKFPSICRTTTTPYVPPTIPPSFPGSCSNGWSPYGDNCYKFSVKNDYAPWFEANYRCQQDDSVLLTLHNSGENAFIQNSMSNANTWDGVWLDLTRNETAVNEYVFLWNDGQVLDYTNWQLGALGSPSNVNKDCVVMMPKAYGKWDPENCVYSNRFVCQKPKVLNPVGGCENGWLRMDNWCYGSFGAYENEAKSWIDAEQDCNNRGGNLATVYGQNVQSILEALFINLKRSTSAWIGLNKMSTGYFVWADGTPYIFQHWDKDSPDDGENNECVYMAYEDTAPGFWRNAPCGDDKAAKLGYFCQKPSDPKLPDLPTGEVCSQDGYFRYGLVCYKVYATQLSTFLNAETQCERDGGTLPSILNGYSEAFMEALLYYYNIKDSWIGLMKGARGDFAWVNNDNSTYTNWDDNEPSTGENDKCVRISDGQKWDALSCDAMHNFICQILEAPPPTKTPTVTPRNQTVAPPPTPGKQAGLGGGAIAGIVIAVIVAIVLALVLGYFLMKNHQASKAPLADPAEANTTGFDNVMYMPSGDDVTFDSKADITDA